MQVVVNGEEYKSLIFPKQSLLLWPISTPCFQVLITALLDCQLREAEREKRERARGGGESQKVGHRNTPGAKWGKKILSFARVSREAEEAEEAVGCLGCVAQTLVNVNTVTVYRAG